MEPSNTPTPREFAIGDISIVLIQHWASMITSLQDRAEHASNNASVAEHQVDILSRELHNTTTLLELEQRRAARMEEHIQILARFTRNAIMWIPDIGADHFIVTEYNSIINEWNGDNPIDLTETESETESDENI